MKRLSIVRSGGKLLSASLAVVLLGILAGIVPMHFGFRPLPEIHDEFSYLLAADTFTHGRLTNPPHALPQFFQTVHELMRPTYMSKFPPGPGLALAAGQWLFGRPIVGAFGTVAIACGVIVWALRGQLPLRWACFGGLLAVCHPLLQRWGQHFWGGGVALLGGALLTGAVLRAARRLDWLNALVAAAGVSVMLISRPLEGCIFSGLCGFYLIAQWRRRGIPLRSVAAFIGLGLIGLLPVIAFTAYDNWRVTGSPTQFPYAVYAAHYQKAPLLFGQADNTDLWPLDPRLSFFRDQTEYPEYAQQTTLRGFASGMVTKLEHIREYTLTPWPLMVLLLPLPWLLRWKRYRWVLALTVGLPLIQVFITPWLRMHYLAPAMPVFFLLLTLGARHLSQRQSGLIISLAVLVYTGYATGNDTWSRTLIDKPPGFPRQNLIDQLSTNPGQHVVLVSYLAGEQQEFEWVFNEADIDAQKVIWARDRGDEDIQLKQLYPDRHFWKLGVQNHTLHFEPFWQLNR